MNTYPRETKEFAPMTVTRNGEPTTQFDAALVKRGSRPANWAPATLINGTPGIMIQNLEPGVYTVWARVNANPETPVIEIGRISIV